MGAFIVLSLFVFTLSLFTAPLDNLRADQETQCRPEYLLKMEDFTEFKG